MIRYLGSALAFIGATLSFTAATAGTYSLCTGEYWMDGRHTRSRCGPVCPAPGGNQLYAYCGADPNVTARSICSQEGSTGKPTVVRTANICGNKCGYSYYTITCQ